MKEAIKTADAFLKANLKNLGIERVPKDYDFSVQAINLNQAKERRTRVQKRPRRSSFRWSQVCWRSRCLNRQWSLAR